MTQSIYHTHDEARKFRAPFKPDTGFLYNITFNIYRNWLFLVTVLSSGLLSYEFVFQSYEHKDMFSLTAAVVGVLLATTAAWTIVYGILVELPLSRLSEKYVMRRLLSLEQYKKLAFSRLQMAGGKRPIRCCFCGTLDRIQQPGNARFKHTHHHCAGCGHYLFTSKPSDKP